MRSPNSRRVSEESVIPTGTWGSAATRTLPVMFGYLPLGAAFGILAIEIGVPWWGALLMSLLIYAGAGQFLAVALMAAGAGLLEVAVATLMLNSRHVFYGLSLLKRFQGAGKGKPYLIFALTDETYSLLTSQSAEERHDHSMALRISALNHLWWILGSLGGAMLSTAIDFDSRGIEFALTALFIVLTLEQARRLRQGLPFIIALFAGFGALLLVPDQHMLLAAIGATCLILLLHYRWSKSDTRGSSV